nr:hypothetical protein [Tanacetum cinerariifolium]
MKFLRSFPSKWNTHVIVWRNKADLDTMSIDDLYNNFKIVEQEVKRTVPTSSSLGPQNIAFLLTPGSTNEVDTTNIQVSTINTPVSTISTHDNTTNLSDATVYAFLANQPNGSQLVHEDLEKIHEDDLEEIDLKSPRNQESMPRNQDSSRKTVNVEDTSSKAMVAIVRAGYGPKASKSVCVDTSNEIKKSLDAPITEDWVYDSDEDESEVMISDDFQHKPEQANQPRKVNQNLRTNRTNWNEMRTQKLGVGFQFTKKAYFVCRSFTHLIKDYDFHDKKMIQKLVLKM